ncbi:MAG: hypothetical protein GX335_00070 [Firmicutes bacterium]|nr:hypothetical protein [Bacillota bacterium]
MKKILGTILAVILAFTVLSGSVCAVGTPLSDLELVETVLYGEPRDGALLERIEQIEMDIYGSPQEGAVLIRIDRIYGFLENPQDAEGGLKLQLNLAEWGFTTSIRTELPLLKRLENMETILFGGPQAGEISRRARDLMLAIWGTTKLDVQEVSLPEHSLVKIELLDPVDSGQAQADDVVNYRVVEDVVVEGRVVVPSGVLGQGRIVEVSSARRLGKDGRVVIDFGRIASLDGTLIKLKVDERATQENKSLELAAGASMAGVILLGPVGLVGGYFVKGKDVRIESNVEFYVETARTARLSGFFMGPALDL